MKKTIGALLTLICVGCDVTGGRQTTADSRLDPVGVPGSPLAQAIRGLSVKTPWVQRQAISLDFDAHHPQGMVKVGDDFYVTSVDTDTSSGFLYRIGPDGALLGEVPLHRGEKIHPGGLDTDGTYLYTGVSEYRPDSSGDVVRIRLDDLAVETVFSADDHIGGALYNAALDQYFGVSWGSRRRFRWDAQGQVLQRDHNPSHFVDYQDCQTVDAQHFLCSGLASAGDGLNSVQTGGLALVDAGSLKIVHEVPLMLFSENGNIATRNPLFAEVEGELLRVWALPDDGQGTIYAWETPLSADTYPYSGDASKELLPPLPPLAQAISQLSHKSEWQEVQRVRLQFNAQHPQGLLKIGDDYFLSAEDSYLQQQGYLFKFDSNGVLKQQLLLQDGAAYHAGGIDFDGETIWLPLAEDSPDSAAVIYAVDPVSMTGDARFAVDDHIGALARVGDDLYGMSWGSRRVHRWSAQGRAFSVQANPTHWVDYQDCQSLGSGYALCFGVISIPQVYRLPRSLGGMYLVHLPTNTLVHGFAWPHSNEHLQPNSQNTGFAELVDDAVRLYFASDDYLGNLFVFEARLGE